MKTLNKCVNEIFVVYEHSNYNIFKMTIVDALVLTELGKKYHK